MTLTGAAPTRAWVDVDLAALVANARAVASRCGVPLLPMVKANGYGLGAVAVSRALEAVEPWGFGVATPEEGAELRAAGLTRPIVVFTPWSPRWLDACREANLTPAIGDPEALRAWGATGRPFHLEIDTGMGRAGVRWDDAGALRAVHGALSGGVACEGVFTHFHSADEAPDTLAIQWDRFQSVVRDLPVRPRLVHAANSAAALHGPRFAADLVRPGIYLYGGAAGATGRTVAALRARVVAVRRLQPGESVGYGASWRAERATTVATLGVGYADGLRRSLSNRGVVELEGVVRPIVGRVTMDMTMVDLGDATVPVGAVATLFGGRVSLDALARAADTISYELLTGLGRRVERRYAEHDA